MLKKISLVLVALALPGLASASIMRTNFEWTGSDDYTMTGYFEYNDDTAGNRVTDGEVLSLVFHVFNAGELIGSNAMATEQDGFNFNFDTRTREFRLGGRPASNRGQAWGALRDSTVGFVAGRAAGGVVSTGLLLNGRVFGRTDSDNPFTIVPAPGTLALIGFALAGFGMSRRRKA